MIKNLQEFYTEAEKSILAFNAFCEEHDLSNISLPDHICYKCESSESFEHVRSLFEHESTYLYQAIISGRRIAYIKMKKPVATILGDIYFLELSDQKVNGSQKEGFDHIEVFPTKETYDSFVSKLEEVCEVTKIERPHHTTHDIKLSDGFIFRCTEEPLVEKIKREEML